MFVILAIWFIGGSTRLHIRVATTANSNDGIDSISELPLNVKTNVRFEAAGRELMLFYNNSFQASGQVSADRISGNATVFVSDPWHNSPSANLGNIKMAEIKAVTAIPTRPLSQVDGVVQQLSAYEKTVVPADYALSFDITPLARDNAWTNIIHYSGDGTNGGPKGRMPGMIMNIFAFFNI